MEQIAIVNGNLVMSVDKFFQLWDERAEIVVRRTIEMLKGGIDPEEWVQIEAIATDYGYCVRTLTDRINDRAIERRKVHGKFAIQRKHIPEILKKHT